MQGPTANIYFESEKREEIVSVFSKTEKETENQQHDHFKPTGYAQSMPGFLLMQGKARGEGKGETAAK